MQMLHKECSGHFADTLSLLLLTEQLDFEDDDDAPAATVDSATSQVGVAA